MVLLINSSTYAWRGAIMLAVTTTKTNTKQQSSRSTEQVLRHLLDRGGEVLSVSPTHVVACLWGSSPLTHRKIQVERRTFVGPTEEMVGVYEMALAARQAM